MLIRYKAFCSGSLRKTSHVSAQGKGRTGLCCPNTLGKRHGVQTKKHQLACKAESVSGSAKLSAKDAVEKGLQLFEEKKYDLALRAFKDAQNADPRPEEAQAAFYNAACCQVKLKQWQDAAESVSTAVNEYNLDYKVAMEDKDFRPLRERREWRDAVEGMKGGVSQKTLIDVRAEQKAPFRLFRLIVVSGVGAGALLGLLIITTRLVSAVKGGEGAPDLQETLQNFAINSAAVAVLGFIFNRDLKKQRADKSVIEREEALARLQVKIGNDRVVTLEALRGSIRPVIVSGTKGQVSRAVKSAAPYTDSLRQRGISVIPLPVSDVDASTKLAALKESFRKESKGFGKSPPPSKPAASAKVDIAPSDKRFELEPYDIEEWREWIDALKKERKAGTDHLYVQIQLDGSVRSSGVGAPSWERLLNDLPVLDSLRTRITDGLRR